MAMAAETEYHEKVSDVEECSICAKIFTNPKTLPCVHTFCLHCLETYARDKKPGDQMACPICRNDFIIPDEGFCKLPNNFFVGKITEIGKMVTVAAKEEICDLCGEQELAAKTFGIDCDHRLCDSCSRSHTKIKHCQNQQVVEVGSQLSAKECNLGSSYCEHHPKELINMYCYVDKASFCLVCCVERHQSHRCVSVDKAAREFTIRLREGLTKVSNRMPESEEAFQKLEKLKEEFTDEVLQTDISIRNAGTKLKELIDKHTETLIQDLRSVTEINLKSFETTAKNIERFQVMSGSFVRYCENRLIKGSPADICRAANRMLTRAHELEKLPIQSSVDNFYCDSVAFRSANQDNLLRQHGTINIVGELRAMKSSEHFIKIRKWISVISPYVPVGVVKISVPLDLGVVDIITKYLNEDFRKIEVELKECSGNMDASKDEPGFIIKGNKTAARKAAIDLLKLADRIAVHDQVIDRPGIPAYFYSKQGTEVLRDMQIKHKVSIQLDNSKELVKPQATANVASTIICRVEVIPGKFMILMHGDITKCKVDAIVNAANEELKHYGGVAAAIAQAAGFKLEEDCIEHVKLKGPLLPGQACVTRAGNLPCKKVIHAVGPRWSGGNKDERNILHMAVESSLTKAEEEGLKSIALPLISAGTFGFPLDLATDIIAGAVKSYFVDNSSTTVREVFFVDNDSRAVASLEIKLRIIQAEGSPQHPEGRREVGRCRTVVARLQDRVIPTREAPATCNIPQRKPNFGVMQRPITTSGAWMQNQQHHEHRHSRHLSKIIFSIYALSKKSIDDVLKDIEDAIKGYIIDIVLDSSLDQENIAKLNPEQIQRIKWMTEIYPVQIEVETGRLKRIRIRGPPVAVTSALAQLHSIYEEVDMRQIKENGLQL